MKIVEIAKSGGFQRSKRGHGLGIGICFSLIGILGGSLTYESSDETGTTATLSLPILSPPLDNITKPEKFHSKVTSSKV